MAGNGGLGEFDEEKDEWSDYQERLDQLFIAKDVAEEAKKKAILLSSCGRGAYRLIKKLLLPKKVAEETYKNICNKLNAHFNPKPSEIVQRFRFYKRDRRDGEPISEFVAELRHLSNGCEFADTLDKMLRDRLVLGVNDEALQQRLLEESALTFESAFEKCQAWDAARNNAKEILRPASDAAYATDAVQHTRHSVPARNDKQYEQQWRQKACFRCLSRRHAPAKCPFKDKSCFRCGKTGHVAKACKTHPMESHAHSKYIEPESESNYHLYRLKTLEKVPPITTVVKVNGCDLDMEIDTGSSLTLVSAATFGKIGDSRDLEKTFLRVKTYSGEVLPVLGRLTVRVEALNVPAADLPLTVVAGKGPSLLGRDWLRELRIDWREVKRMDTSCEVDRLLQEYATVFSEDLGTYSGPPVRISLREQASPKFIKARPVPFAIREQVEKQIDEEVRQGILIPVQHSEWASPMVAVLKSDKKSVRICADFKQTLNPATETDHYPPPVIRDLFAQLSGGRRFSKLDLRNAYLQLPLDDQSQACCTINTLRGLMRYTRLPFGIKAAPGIFQRTIESVLRGVPHCVAYFDDVLITGADDNEHIKNLTEALKRLKESGLKCNKEKCTFMAESVEYLGHRIDANGLHPTASRVAALQNAPAPRNITQLRSFLGMLNAYSHFLHNATAVLEPLHRLTRKSTPWRWQSEEEAAFQRAKTLVSEKAVLAHFDPRHPLTLECDASQYGVGAVLFQDTTNGRRPVIYASRSMSETERRYSQLEKEALAAVFGVQKFHTYLFGRRFTLVSDHKPLLGLLKEDKAVPVLASGRIQRWALTLAMYDYKLVYKTGMQLHTADALSRLPSERAPSEPPSVPEVVLMLEHLDEGPVHSSQIKAMTVRDPQLSRVLRFTECGWPDACPADLQAFFNRRLEISESSGCLFLGARVIVPAAARDAILQTLHQAHQGISRTKALARAHVWWPGLDVAIERLVRSCHLCQESQKLPPAAPMNPWPWPARPWSRIHVDYAGPVNGKMLLIMVDAHSKWIEVHAVGAATSAATIERMRTSFAAYGVPDMLVSDNGSAFTSQEMAHFMQKNGIQHVTIAPYHPSSNGLAERAVQTVKAGLRKQIGGSLETRLSRFLLAYRVTPHATTGVPPCELLQGRKLHTHLDLLKPDVQRVVGNRQQLQKEQHDKSARARSFTVGESVRVRDVVAAAWRPATISTATGPTSYECRLPDSRIVRRHVDHVIAAPVREENARVQTGEAAEAAESSCYEEQTEPEESAVRKSSRVRKPPERLSYE